MIVVASYQTGEGSERTKLPVYVKLGKNSREQDSWFDDMIALLTADDSITSVPGRTYIHFLGS
jgi:hypothetical protein